MKKVLISSLIIAFITALIVIIFHNKNSDVHEGDKMALIATKAKKIARVTGPTLEGETIPNPNQTHEKWGLRATDLGIVWDATTNQENKKVMIAFGDSYDDGWGGFGGGGDPTGWRGNLLAISHDDELDDGLSFSYMITDEDNPSYAKEIIYSEHNTSGSGDFTAIPTAGITVGNRHFIHYMQIRNWGAEGRWNTNFSEIAYSDDEGQNWYKSGVKWPANSKFAQAAFIKEEGYVYMFGTPAGRFEPAYLARVLEANILDKDEYEYWNGKDWIKEDESVAVPVIEAPVSELSVAYNSHFKKYIMIYLNENRYAVVMRSSDGLTHGWSDEVEIATGEEFPGLYGTYIHPWTNDSTDLYFLMSEWGPYNVVLMKSELMIGTPKPNLVQDPSFESQEEELSLPWELEAGEAQIDTNLGFSRAGSKNVFLRNNEGWSAITQIVKVKPFTNYQLIGFVKTSSNNTNGSFGVRDHKGNVLKQVPFTSHERYHKVMTEFNSGDSKKITIFIGMEANGETWIQIDDVMLMEKEN